ncbi:hypothetical protein [Bacteroides acidifaciens]|uniref:hypothetical protein n=1 Tax=Bacteroides acidifaciens TaxID=85831 RepID=UPI0026ECF7A6|nr:hypothetical protein [Bacteroides acidifaciens]
MLDNELLNRYEEALMDISDIEQWAYEKLFEFRAMYKREHGQYRRTDVWPHTQLSEDGIRLTIEYCKECINDVDLVSDYGSWKEVLANV